jgi:hypothetical protein
MELLLGRFANRSAVSPNQIVELWEAIEKGRIMVKHPQNHSAGVFAQKSSFLSKSQIAVTSRFSPLSTMRQESFSTASRRFAFAVPRNQVIGDIQSMGRL